MRGEVTQFNEDEGAGTISGDDGIAYRFEISSVRSALPLAVRQRVDFVVDSGNAIEIIALARSVKPNQGPATLDTDQGIGGSGFDLGRVVRQTFQSIRVNWATFTIMSVVLVGIPSLLQVYGQTEFVNGQMTGGFVFSGIGLVAWIIGTYILQGMVVKVTVTGLSGNPMGMGAAFEAGVRLFFPLLGLGIVAGLGAGLGFLLLIVPGIILSVMWSAAAGAVVVEGRGVFAALGRSRELTRGYRWPIFGLALIYTVVSLIIGGLAGGIGAATGGSFVDGSANLGVNMVVSAFSNIFSSVIGAAGVAALYYELRSVKEGVGPEQLAAIFD